MRDALHTLQKLPEKCASVQDGIAVFIRRGARSHAPAHIPSDQVDQWNQAHGIEPHVRLAMEAGLNMGWDSDAADPDSHAPELGGPFRYTFVGEITVQLVVTSNNEADAANEARDKLQIAADLAAEEWSWHAAVFGVSDTLDLIETTDPR